MQVKAARQGLRVVEVPVDYRPRIGRSKVSGTVRGTVGAGTKIIATILRHASLGSGPRGRGSDPVAWLDAWLVAAGLDSRHACSRGRSGPSPRGGSARTSGSFGVAFAAYLAALAASRGLSRRGLLALPRPGPPLAGRARGRPAAPEQRHQPLRLGGARPGPRREPVPLERPAGVAALAAAARRRLRRAQPQGLHRGLPAAVRPRDARRRGRARLLHRHEGVPRRVRARDPRRARPRPATPASPARAAPRPRLEPARPRRDRRQRAQRGLRHAVDGARAPRPRRRPAPPLRPRRERRLHDEVPARPRGRRVGAALPVVARARGRSAGRGRSWRSTSIPPRRRRCC